MKKHLKTLMAVIIITIAAFQMNSCAKKSNTPEEKCRTCVARGGIDFSEVDSAEVCTDAAEQAFRNDHTGFTVNCK